MNEIKRFTKLATSFSNRIINVLTYYGNTIAIQGKITSSTIRPLIEDFISGKEIKNDGLFKKPPETICEIKNYYLKNMIWQKTDLLI
jgi:hypothetical protein